MPRSSSRSGYGRGSVEPLPSGHLRASITLGGQRYRRTFPSEPPAAAWLADLRAQHATGTLPPPAVAARSPTADTTVGSCLDAFLRSVRGTVTAKTWGEYARAATLHLGALRALPLTTLTAQLVRDHRLALRDGTAPGVVGPRTPRTLRVMVAVLRRACAQAVEEGQLTRNPVAAVRALRSDPPPMRVLSKAEQRRLLADAAARGDRLAALWLVALRTGARLAELLGLTWADVDLAAGRVTVWRQLGSTAGRRPAWKPRPKTAAGVRLVHLPARTVAALRDHRARQDGERLRYGSAYHDYDLVFAARWGTPLGQRHVLAAWQRACARAGVPVLKLHEARHTAASTYLAAGVPLPEVSQILGHASPQVTAAVYAHAVQRYARAAADALERFLDEGDEDEPGAETGR